MSTLYFFAVLGSLLALQILMATVALRLVAGRFSSRPGWRRCIAVALILAMLDILVVVTRLSLSDPATELNDQVLLNVFTLLMAVGVGVFLIVRGFELGISKSALALVCTYLFNIPLVLILAYLVRPYLADMYFAPTNSMAPTILGIHWTGTCPECGAAAYCSPEEYPRYADASQVLMICSQELRGRIVVNPSHTVARADHFFANKLMTPRRWDVVAFELPSDPAVNYVKRLVGLPGETVEIRDGAVWIDGARQEPPSALAGLQYFDRILDEMPPAWGSSDRPAQLGPDEYFMLGDFSQAANDSRFWQEGAPGRPAFAVPTSHILGVVTHIYWPPSRWRVLR